MTEESLLSPLFVSLRVSLIAALWCLLFGTPIGVWLARTQSRLKWAVEVVALAPLVFPPVATGLLLLLILRSVAPGLLFTWWAAVIASTIVALPLLIRTVRAAVEAADPRLPTVAKTLGATRSRVFFTITLPLAWKGIVGGTALAWARALGEFGATIVVAGNMPGETRTIPLAIWSAVQSPTAPPVWPLLVAAALLSLSAVAISEWMVHRPKTMSTN